MSQKKNRFPEPKIQSASSIERKLAFLLDLIIYVAVLFAIAYFFKQSDSKFEKYQFFVQFAFVLVYEPLMVHLKGGSIGHLLLGIRVEQMRTERRHLTFTKALLRFICKIMFGSKSKMTYNKEGGYQMMHDSIADARVVKR